MTSTDVPTTQPSIVEPIRRRNYGRNHAYYIGDTKLDGVTTAIKNGLPSPALMYWSARTVAEHVADSTNDDLDVLRRLGRGGMVNALKGIPWAKRDAAALRGTELHAYAEQLIHGEKIDITEEQAGLVNSVVKFMNEWRPRPVLVEKTVGSRQWMYAGTFDLIADLPDGRRILFDYKTSASGIWPETALQLAAYRWAECYVDDGAEIPMNEVGITDAMAVWVRSDGYDVIPVNTSDDVYRTFLHVLYVARRCARPNRDTPSVMDSWIRPAVRP